LVADNLAGGKRWYDGFSRLLADRDARRRVIKYEWKGLQAMARENELVDDQEMRFIVAIHQAIYMARGRIYADTMGKEASRHKIPANEATKKRWERLMERLRLDVLGAKTQSRTQAAISELLVRAGTVKELRNQEALRLVKNLTFGEDWQRARNLALFAIASYKRPADAEPVPGDAQEGSEVDNTVSLS
jgi:CRISPR-associated protein Cas8a1/Csx13